MRSFLFLLVLLVSACIAPAQRFVKTVNSWADLLSLNPNDVHTNAFVNYGFTVDDTLGGVFTYYSNATDATNTATVLKPYSYDGRWMKRMGAGISNYYATNIYGSNIYATNLYVGTVVSNMTTTNFVTDSLTATNATFDSTNVTINGVYVIVPNFDANQFLVSPTATPPLVDVTIKNGANVTNLTSQTRLIAQSVFAMGAAAYAQIASAATSSVATASSSWIDMDSDSAVPGARVLSLDAGANNGQMLVIRNVGGANTFTLPNSSAVTGGGQVNLAGADWQAKPGEAILLIYDESFQDWNEIGRFGSGTTAGIVANLTPGYIPYATSTNTLGDSPLYRASPNVLGFGSSTPFLHKDGARVTALGENAMPYNIDASGYEVAIGYEAALNRTNGFGGTFVGARAGKNITNGPTAVTLIGYQSGAGASNITQSTGVGAFSLVNAKANFLTAVGYNAIPSATAGPNDAVGVGALRDTTTGQHNLAFGYFAGLRNTTGSRNIMMGANTGFSNLVNSDNIFIGFNSGYSNTTAASSVLIGSYSATDSTNAIAVGYGTYAPSANSSVIGNTNVASLYIGKVGKVDTSDNVALGTDALKANTTNSNVAIGAQAMYQSTIAQQNVAVGDEALYSVTSGDVRQVVAVGPYAMRSKTSGQNGVAVGSNALRSETTGTQNTAVGPDAGFSQSTGIDNVYVGYQAGYYGTAGQNVIVGSRAALATTSGANNTVVGYAGIQANVTGGNNTVIGTGLSVATNVSKTVIVGNYQQGSVAPNVDVMTNNIVNSVFIGYKDTSITNNVPGLTNVVSIGYNTIPTNNNEIVIGNSSNTKAIFPITSFSGEGNKFLSDDGKYRSAYSILTGNYTDWDYFIPTNYYAGNLTSGNTTIFTVPAGKRFMLTAMVVGTTNTAGSTVYSQILTNGNYYPIFASTSVTTNLPTLFTTSAIPQVFEENESYAFNTSSDGVNAFASGFLFPTNSPIKVIRSWNIGTGPAAVYTVPSGKYAVGAFNTQNSYPVYFSPLLMNRSGGARVYALYIVPNGASADLTTRVWGGRSVSDNSGLHLQGSFLTAGGSVWVESDSAAAGQNVIGHVVELPIP
jgi:hypothetical protein